MGHPLGRHGLFCIRRNRPHLDGWVVQPLGPGRVGNVDGGAGYGQARSLLGEDFHVWLLVCMSVGRPTRGAGYNGQDEENMERPGVFHRIAMRLALITGRAMMAHVA